jgi:hypothetical protein
MAPYRSGGDAIETTPTDTRRFSLAKKSQLAHTIRPQPLSMMSLRRTAEGALGGRLFKNFRLYVQIIAASPRRGF